MHAASVHPEPGSNSLKNVISTASSRRPPKPFSELIILASLTFSSYSMCFLTRFLHTYSVFEISVVQFSKTKFLSRACPWTPARPLYYTPLKPVCQYFFQKFFNFFQSLDPLGLSEPLNRRPSSRGARLVYHFLSLLSIPFSKLF